jgi:hypothetical protein
MQTALHAYAIANKTTTTTTTILKMWEPLTS